MRTTIEQEGARLVRIAATEEERICVDTYLLLAWVQHLAAFVPYTELAEEVCGPAAFTQHSPKLIIFMSDQVPR